MFAYDGERCNDCGAPLLGGAGRTLEDELLCERCYEKKSKSVRWLLVQIIADGSLVVAGIIALLISLSLPMVMIFRAGVFAATLIGLVYARPAVIAFVKDLLMKRKTH
ncbi:MAG: LIM domain-containing protein [Planctomycetota bacterium]